MRIAVCGLLLALALIMAWEAFQIGGPAGVYPIAITLGTSAVAACYLVMEVVRGGADMPAATLVERPTPAAVVRTVAFAAVWLIYVLALPYLGFVASTWIALYAALALSFGTLSVWSAVSSGLFTLILAILMKTILYVPVPQGWADTTLDVLIYRLF